jgi:hypothetical protein
VIKFPVLEAEARREGLNLVDALWADDLPLKLRFEAEMKEGVVKAEDMATVYFGFRRCLAKTRLAYLRRQLEAAPDDDRRALKEQILGYQKLIEMLGHWEAYYALSERRHTVLDPEQLEVLRLAVESEKRSLLALGVQPDNPYASWNGLVIQDSSFTVTRLEAPGSWWGLDDPTLTFEHPALPRFSMAANVLRAPAASAKFRGANWQLSEGLYDFNHPRIRHSQELKSGVAPLDQFLGLPAAFIQGQARLEGRLDGSGFALADREDWNGRLDVALDSLVFKDVIPEAGFWGAVHLGLHGLLKRWLRPGGDLKLEAPQGLSLRLVNGRLALPATTFKGLDQDQDFAFSASGAILLYKHTFDSAEPGRVQPESVPDSWLQAWQWDKWAPEAKQQFQTELPRQPWGTEWKGALGNPVVKLPDLDKEMKRRAKAAIPPEPPKPKLPTPPVPPKPKDPGGWEIEDDPAFPRPINPNENQPGAEPPEPPPANEGAGKRAGKRKGDT